MHSFSNLFSATIGLHGGKNMIIIIILFVMFMCVAIGHIIQQKYIIKNTSKNLSTEYIFDQELLDMDLDSLKIEKVSDNNLTLEKMRDRGSVRIAQELVFDSIEFEKRKAEEYFIKLP